MSKKIDRQKSLKTFQAKQAGIRFESNEDEGAAEYWAELQSVIEAIQMHRSDAEIFGMASMISEEYLLTFEEA